MLNLGVCLAEEGEEAEGEEGEDKKKNSETFFLEEEKATSLSCISRILAMRVESQTLP